ncbi:MAG: alpha/beta fold hydrolase [Bacillota bacterium]
MRNCVRAVLVIALSAMILFSGCAAKQQDQNNAAAVPEEIQRLALSFADDFIGGNLDEAVGLFDTRMNEAVPLEDLKKLQEQIAETYGEFLSRSVYRSEQVDGYNRVEVKTDYQKGSVLLLIVFSSEKLVSGFYVQPFNDESANPVALPEGVTEQEMAVNSGSYALAAKLTLPQTGEKLPAVVLVHGSGPLDMDSTVGANKPFRDIAYALAQKGIAVLRYDKRTYTYAGDLDADAITVNEESVQDAVAAFKLLASCDRIDPNRVFVLGHSLGGMLIPMIAEQTPDAAGYVMMAAPARKLQDLILEQYEYILSLDPGEDAEQTLDKIREQVQAVNTLDANSDLTPDQLLGIPRNYWLNLNAYDPIKALQAVASPVLILQGERDYQVTMTDFNLFKDALQARADVKFISYPKLNHLFMAGEGEKSTPEEYYTPSSVDSVPLNDIAQWIEGVR